MIITRIDGGLGNQMFQYAYGLYLAKKHGSELRLDTSSFASQPQHGYLLDRFLVNTQVAEEKHLARLPRRYRPDKRIATRVSIGNFLSGTSLKRHKESTFGFHKDHLDVADNRYLVGYWQSERFFPGMRDELLQRFRPCQLLTAASRAVSEQILSTNSLAVHVRRGDYVNNASNAKIYSQLPIDYYRRAIDGWAKTQQSPVVFVFSNDIAWCRERFDFRWTTHFVEHNSAATAHEDLILMSQAKCCVIANSTFSWWAAWLNERPDKLVFAPTEWFKPGTLDGSNIIPSHWLTCECQSDRRAA